MALVFAPDTSFTIDHAAAAPNAAAERPCAHCHPGDLAAQAKCKSEARNDFVADVLVFVKKPGNRPSLTFYRRHGSQLPAISQTQVVSVEAQGDLLVLKTRSGRGRGRSASGTRSCARPCRPTAPSRSRIRARGMLDSGARIGLVAGK